VHRTTTPQGELTLTLAPGHYQFHLAHPGFQPVSQQLDIRSAQSLTLVLPLAASADNIDVHADTFLATDATTATRLPLSVLQTPQQLDVLTPELLRARATESMKSALELIPAAGLQLGEGRRDNFFLRGFNAVTDMYIDGVRDDAQYYRDLSNTDRIEVLEGPAAVLYGRGSSGGLINRITKKPSLGGTLLELSDTTGSYGEQRGTADLDTLIPGTRHLGLRLTGAAEQSGSQRHDFWLSRYAFAPTLAWHPTAATTLSAQVERLRDDRLPDRGIPYLPATGLPAPVPVGNFYGYVGPQPGSNFIHSAVTDGTLDEKHDLANGWQLHATQRLAGYTTGFLNMYASSVTPIAGSANDYLVARGEYNGTQLWRTAFANLEASRTLHWLGRTQTILIGTEYGRESTDATQYTGPANQTPVDLLNPAPVAPVLSTTLAKNNRFLAQTYAIYAQDLIQLTPHWKALVGARFDSFRQTLDLRPPTNTTPDLGRTDNDVSPRVGLVYQARPWYSTYLNYSRTFDPSGEGLTLATNNAQLAPEVTQNYEAGAKANLFHDRLLATTSLFRLDRTNIKTTDPNNPTALVNLGEQRTDGAELNLQGAINRHWQLFGGYAWLDARIVSSNTLSNGVNLQGDRPAMVPLHSGSAWTTYTFTNGFGFGGGMVARSLQFAATDNLAHLPAYARLDATIFYRRRRFDLQANLQNLANQRIYDAAQSDYQIYPAAPISGTLTARYRF
jgi:catecholate siderophore receptor